MAIANMLNNAGLMGRVFLRKPRFLARTALNFTLSAILGEPRMRFMDIAVDYAGNLSCEHCSALPMHRRDEPPLSVDEYRRIAGELRAAGVVLFHFTGGEPLLRKDLEDVIQTFGPESACISIQTNGFPVTPKRLSSLRSAGVDILSVSLDSGIEEEHDAFRGRRGSYAKVLEVLEMASTMGFITTVSTCLSHANIRSEGLKEVIDKTRRMGVSCQFNLAVPTGHWQDNAAIVLTEEDKVEARRLLKANPHCRLDLYHNWNKIGCGAIKEKLYLSSFGDVQPCPFIQIGFGNLKQQTLREVRENAFRVEQFRKYWPECLAAEDHRFMEQVAAFSKYSPVPLVQFDHDKWCRGETRDTQQV
jgi:MoaA/NifB/PqqE/SkfB family radical SAM enzyme